MDINLSKLREIVEDRGAWHAAVHGVAKSWTWLIDWTTTKTILCWDFAEYKGWSQCMITWSLLSSGKERIHLPMQEMQETQIQSLGREDPLEKEMATHSSILAWRIPWTEEPGGLQSMGSQSCTPSMCTCSCVHTHTLAHRQSVQFSRSVVSDSLWLHGLQYAMLLHPSPAPELAQTHIHWIGDATQPSHPLSSPSPPAFNLSQHQGLFQWVSSSHHVGKYWRQPVAFIYFISTPHIMGIKI